MAFILWHLLQYYQILVKLSSGSYSLNGRLHLLSAQGGGGLRTLENPGEGIKKALENPDGGVKNTAEIQGWCD